MDRIPDPSTIANVPFQFQNLRKIDNVNKSKPSLSEMELHNVSKNFILVYLSWSP
jgi:hypothetical protein